MPEDPNAGAPILIAVGQCFFLGLVTRSFRPDGTTGLKRNPAASAYRAIKSAGGKSHRASLLRARA